MGRKLFPKGMPTPAVIWDQIQLAQMSTTVYAMLPVLGEFFIEEGYTRYVCKSLGRGRGAGRGQKTVTAENRRRSGFPQVS